MSSLGIRPHIKKIRGFIQRERVWREGVFRAGTLDKNRKREEKLADCDAALAALDTIEQVFIPRVTQEQLPL